MAAYLCMYAFRRPFAAATFTGQHVLGLDYKAWLVIAQIFGYMCSKFLGIRVISGLKRVGRARFLLLLIGAAALALLGFALTPSPWNIAFLFLNGLPLGLVWGVLFSYLEGRRSTELMGAMMASSMIFASGIVKTAGRYFLALGVSEYWMPVLTGVAFVPLLLACLVVLERMPQPDAADRGLRGARVPMSAADRRRFATRFLPGIALMVFCYAALTIVRDFRDSFEIELFTELGYGNRIALFAQVETPIAFLLLLCTAGLVMVRENLRALMLVHAMMFTGVILAGCATLAFRAGTLPPLWWLGLVGFGLYLAYVPFTCAFEERMVATFKGSGNVGFMMYVCDAFGYLGSIAVVLVRESGWLHVSWTGFLAYCVLGLALLGAVSVACSAMYFYAKARHESGAPLVSAPAIAGAK
ncbi:DUF5690 family protein [Dokdonella soli]|uniref:DUF5690 family protein n=2 Tax=Dokdonella soli TaxID=529810 RepID=A0ABN1IRD3_9GAMM